MHRVSRVVLSALLLLSVAACRGGDRQSAAGTQIPDGWRVERDPDYSIAVPPDWRSKPGTSSIGTEFVNLLGPAEVDGYPQGVVIGRTPEVGRDFVDDFVGTFQNVHPERTFSAERKVAVEGSTAAILLESTWPVRDKPVTLRSWNVFAGSPSSVLLNVELVAPRQIFDEVHFNQILQSLTVRKRGS